MKKLYEETDVQAIANAIRAKNGTTTTYKIGEMEPRYQKALLNMNCATIIYILQEKATVMAMLILNN